MALEGVAFLEIAVLHPQRAQRHDHGEPVQAGEFLVAFYLVGIALQVFLGLQAVADFHGVAAIAILVTVVLFHIGDFQQSIQMGVTHFRFQGFLGIAGIGATATGAQQGKGEQGCHNVNATKGGRHGCVLIEKRNDHSSTALAADPMAPLLATGQRVD